MVAPLTVDFEQNSLIYSCVVSLLILCSMLPFKPLVNYLDHFKLGHIEVFINYEVGKSQRH